MTRSTCNIWYVNIRWQFSNGNTVVTCWLCNVESVHISIVMSFYRSFIIHCILISLIEQKWLKFLTCSYDRVVDKDILREFNVNAVSVRATFWSCYMHILNQNITTLIYHYMEYGTVNGVNVTNSTLLARYDIQCLQYTVQIDIIYSKNAFKKLHLFN